jgi:hypothetical protein
MSASPPGPAASSSWMHCPRSLQPVLASATVRCSHRPFLERWCMPPEITRTRCRVSCHRPDRSRCEQHIVASHTEITWCPAGAAFLSFGALAQAQPALAQEADAVDSAINSVIDAVKVRRASPFCIRDGSLLVHAHGSVANLAGHRWCTEDRRGRRQLWLQDCAAGALVYARCSQPQQCTCVQSVQPASAPQVLMSASCHAGVQPCAWSRHWPHA